VYNINPAVPPLFTAALRQQPLGHSAKVCRNENKKKKSFEHGPSLMTYPYNGRNPSPSTRGRLYILRHLSGRCSRDVFSKWDIYPCFHPVFVSQQPSPTASHQPAALLRVPAGLLVPGHRI